MWRHILRAPYKLILSICRIKIFGLRRTAGLVGVAIIILFITVALAAPLLSLHDPNFQSRINRGEGGVALPPVWIQGGKASYVLGTDRLGRDILSRLLFGARISLLVGVIPALISVSFGAIVGVSAGYLEGNTERVLMRFTELALAFPSILFLLVLIALLRNVRLGPYHIATIAIDSFYLNDVYGGLPVMIIALSATAWAETARLMRSQTLTLRETQFVESAVVLGASRLYIIRVYLVMNLMPLIITSVTTMVPNFILDEAFLSFIGLGIRPPTPSWGTILNEGYKSIQELPQMIWAPVLCITLLTFGFYLISENTV